MTDLALAPSRFSSRRSISPGALGAAIAVHVGVAAIIIALPPEFISTERITRLIVKNVPMPPAPQPVEKPRTEPKVIATHATSKPLDQRPTVFDTDLDSQGPQIGGESTSVDPPQPYPPYPEVITPPARQPVLTSASADPRYADAFQPAYPPAKLRQGEEGSCTVRVTIDARGRVTSAAAVRSSDPAFCAPTERQALSKWRFRPATRDGIAIATEKELTVQFRMQN